MNYLITGGAGFIGSNLVNKLVEDKQQVTVIDDLSMGRKENLHEMNKIKFIKGSVTDQSLMTEVLKSETFDYIFHFAAIASVADSIARPIATHHVNYESVLYLLELCKKYQHSLKRLVFSSSAAVYGNGSSQSIKETNPANPLSQYAVDKFAGERTLLNYYRMFDIPVTIVRFFNVYGPNQNPDSPYSGVISILIRDFQQYRERQSVSFSLFGDGEQTRDFVFVNDVIEALLLLADSDQSLGEIYNVGTGKSVSLNHVIQDLKKIYEVKIPIQKSAARKGDIRISVADNEKLSHLGFTPEIMIYEGLKELSNYNF